MKYIIFKGSTGMPLPIIFPDWVDHGDVNRAITTDKPGLKAVGAGKFSIGPDQDADNIFTHGMSVSLNMKPGSDDEKILVAAFKQHEFV